MILEALYQRNLTVSRI